MYWFGDSWDAPVCETTHHIATPVGELCQWCGPSCPIEDGDQGFVLPLIKPDGFTGTIYFHRVCFLREIGIYEVITEQGATDDPTANYS